MKLPKLTKKTVEQHKEHFLKVTESHQRKWGKLDAHGMIVHIQTVFLISLEEMEVMDRSNFFTRSFIFKKLFFEILPVPKGKIKVPDIVTPKPTRQFHEDMNILMNSLDHFVEEVERTPDRIVLYPIMGHIPLSYWSHIHARHNAHHLSQFGIE